MTDESIKTITENAAITILVITTILSILILKCKKLKIGGICQVCGDPCRQWETRCEDCRET